PGRGEPGPPDVRRRTRPDRRRAPPDDRAHVRPAGAARVADRARVRRSAPWRGESRCRSRDQGRQRPYLRAGLLAPPGALRSDHPRLCDPAAAIARAAGRSSEALGYGRPDAVHGSGAIFLGDPARLADLLAVDTEATVRLPAAEAHRLDGRGRLRAPPTASPAP